MLNNNSLRLSGLKFEKSIIKAGLLQQKAAKPSRLKFRFQVQVPTTVNELMLSAYNSLICYILSDDGVSRLRLVVIVRQRESW